MPQPASPSPPPPPPRVGPAPSSPPISVMAPAGRKAQFSMRSLMIVMTVAAVAAALTSYIGVRRSIDIALAVWLTMLPTALGTLAIYCRGYRRTLFAGAFAGSLGPMFAGAGIAGSIGFVVYQLVSAAICAITALGSRRFLESRGWHRLGNDDEPPANR